MLKKIFVFIFVSLLCVISVSAELRSLRCIFPNIDETAQAAIFSETGLVNSDRRNFLAIGRSTGLDPQITNAILRRNPGFIVESISVIPSASGAVTLLDVYNALSNIRGLEGRLYHSATRNQYIPLFEEATRIVGERQTNPIPDPPPARAVPSNETIFIRLRDANFGNSFYRAEMTQTQYGLKFTLTNFRNLTWLLVPVIREGNLIAQLYFEPIKEGVLIYGIIGADVSNFVASRIHMNSAIAKRLEVIIEWASDGIKGKN